MDATLNSSLLLVGVGGGGCKAAAAAARRHGKGLRAIGFDTDLEAVRGVEGIRCVPLGDARLDGLGAAGSMDMAALAATETLPDVLNAFEGVRTAVVVAALGGGTGGGVTPVLLDQLRDLGVATLCYVLMPWGFEDPSRMDAARHALALIGPRAGTLVTLAPDDLLADAGLDANASLGDVMARCGRALSEHLLLLWRVMSAPEHIRFDPGRLRALVAEGGAA
ncbi:MAG: hypothetical protein FWF96_06425, partial [Kiritimatiellaeota bacterium]|nr:hypothetical protein [Kiritimatiellota bacterium]